MDLEEKAKIYNDGFKKGQNNSHNNPSSQTLKFMENTDKRLEKVETKISDLCENHLPHLEQSIQKIESNLMIEIVKIKGRMGWQMWLLSGSAAIIGFLISRFF